MKKRIIISITVVLIVLLALLLGLADSHHTNAKYLLWKHGWTGYDPSTALRYLNVDVEFRLSLRGKAMPEVKQWYPDLRPMSQANDYQRHYNQSLEGRDFFWIGESAWGIEFENGEVKEFHLRKG